MRISYKTWNRLDAWFFGACALAACLILLSAIWNCQRWRTAQATREQKFEELLRMLKESGVKPYTNHGGATWFVSNTFGLSSNFMGRVIPPSKQSPPPSKQP